MENKEIEAIILGELEKGSTPEEIVELAKSAEITEEEVEASFLSLQQNPAFAQATFVPLLNQFIIPQKSKSKPVEASTAGVWDPLGNMPSDLILEDRNTKVQNRYEKWKKNPKKIKIIFGLLVAFASLIYFPLFLIPGVREMVFLQLSNVENSQGLLVLPALPAVGYFLYIKKTQIDVIKKLVADKYGWKYDPSEQKNRWEKALNLMPELFNKGNNSQDIQDQFWGKYEGMDFWSGVFHYQISSGSGKNRKNSKYDTHFVCVKIPKELKNRFTLLPESITGKLMNAFKKKDIDIESEEFNKAFQISYRESKTERELDIVNTLSPSVQVRLLDMKQKTKSYTLLLANDTAVFLFKGRLFKKMHSNFITRGVFLDSRDQEYLESKLKDVLSITKELIPYVK